MRAWRGVVWALAVAVGTGTALAHEHLVVVELYTSQGCSSCPPADALFEELAARPGILALALHVDYWDYIGWADTFAQPGFTERQKAYARAAGSRTLYTPQMVVGGRDHLVGSESMELGQLIELHRAAAPAARVGLRRIGAALEVTAEAPEGLDRPVTVQLVRYKPRETVAIERGENAGRTLTYVNIVTEWRPVGRWTGEAPLSLVVEAPGDLPAAVILQEDGQGPIIAAAALR
jgi:hypothetical protein